MGNTNQCCAGACDGVATPYMIEMEPSLTPRKNTTAISRTMDNGRNTMVSNRLSDYYDSNASMHDPRISVQDLNGKRG